jgi:hypothetical protein
VLTRCAAAAGAVLLLAVGGPATASASDSAPIKVHVTLLNSRVVAGQEIKGTILLTNVTKQTITVNTCAANGWLQVGLKGHGYTYKASSLLIMCPPSIQLAPGANRFSVTVLTSYQSCQRYGGNSLTPTPKCTSNNGLPPLPSGKYSTTVSIFGLEHLTRPPNRVTVSLMRAS